MRGAAEREREKEAVYSSGVLLPHLLMRTNPNRLVYDRTIIINPDAVSNIFFIFPSLIVSHRNSAFNSLSVASS
jgi:hypothetical protein